MPAASVALIGLRRVAESRPEVTVTRAIVPLTAGYSPKLHTTMTRRSSTVTLQAPGQIILHPPANVPSFPPPHYVKSRTVDTSNVYLLIMPPHTAPRAPHHAADPFPSPSTSPTHANITSQTRSVTTRLPPPTHTIEQPTVFLSLECCPSPSTDNSHPSFRGSPTSTWRQAL